MRGSGAEIPMFVLGGTVTLALVLQVPDAVRNVASSLGASDWLDGLPGLLADLAGEWDPDATPCPRVAPTDHLPTNHTMSQSRGHT